MNIAIYLCKCGGNVSDKIDFAALQSRFAGESLRFLDLNFPCSEDGQSTIEEDIRAHKPDRVIVVGCSPREHESTFRGVLSRAGMNPYLMQIVNVREHVAWVVADKVQATEKAALYLRAAIERVKLQEPLEKKLLDVNLSTLVIGAGPAGLRAALTLAEAGRKVILVEKNPIIGGLPVLYEEVFPNLECGPCVLEPLMAEVLQGPHAEHIELLTLSQVTEVLGFYGNFNVRIRREPRYVSTRTCIGCSMCLPACPASAPDAFTFGLSERKAIAFAFVGGLPNAPFIDPQSCIRLKNGQDCNICRASCPIENTINFDERPQELQRNVGAIVVAAGGGLYDCSALPQLGFGSIPNVVHSLQFERLLSSNGPSGGKLVTKDGSPAKRVAVVHCVGSLDACHKHYCSSVCCSYAFKFSHLIQKKEPAAEITHYFKALCLPGKHDHKLYTHALHDSRTKMVQYADLSQMKIRAAGAEAKGVEVRLADSQPSEYDMVVLCPAIVPGADAGKLGKLLDITADREGFFEERHGMVESSKTKVRGVYLAGTCRAPMNIQQATSEGAAAAGNILAALVEGRKLEIEPVVAWVDAERCSGCLCCVPVCPYKAIRHDPVKDVAEVNAVLCTGCGTCVASCPIEAIKGAHFTKAQIMAELKGVLA
ncbi:MAG TPA: CoB--CoM heterodisulfide reductase iron-sulfur subunit A family protein [Planctomycetota bacterium]|jgi:heterodisulfide reductase subunit A